MHYINITVREKNARADDRARIVCGNSDYTVRFDFDEEWAEYAVKTARFITEGGFFTDVQFSGSDCAVPVLSGTRTLLVGVFAGDVRTTTPAYIPAIHCITDPDGTPADPTPDVYAQLMERFNAMEAPAAVLYTAQELTDEQKAQARANIGAMDMPSGGEREWTKIGEVTNAEDTAGPFYMKFTKDINGNSLSLKGVIIIGTPLFSDTNTHPCALKCNDFPYSSSANFFLYRSILRNKQTFVIYSEFLRGDGVNSVVVTVSNSGNVKQNGGAESYINTWSPSKEEFLQFPIRGIDFGVIDSGLLTGSKFEFWGVKA